MDLPYDNDDDHLADMTLKTITPSIETFNKECAVCGFIQNEWTYHQYPCGHYGHTRCVRKWQKTTTKIYGRNTIQCPWCREQTPDKIYCKQCNCWTDHNDMECDKCPVMQDMDYEQNAWLYQPRKISRRSYKRRMKL